MIENKVYDVTQFKHPGGKQILLQNAGQDATTQFEDIGHSDKAYEHMKELFVGDFKPEDDDADAGKKGALQSNADGDMMTKLLLVVAFFAVLGLLYTMIE